MLPDDDTTWWEGTRSDRNAGVRAMRERDAEQSAEFKDDYEREQREQSSTPEGSSSSGRPASRSTPRGGGSVGATLADAFLGLIVFAIGSAWLSGGAPAVRSWIKAKFINRPDLPTTAVAS
jgi:hypothetical protein